MEYVSSYVVDEPDKNKEVAFLITDWDGKVKDYIYKGDIVKREEELIEQKDYYERTQEINGEYVKLLRKQILPVIKQCKDQKGKVRYDLIALLFYLMDFIAYGTGLLLHSNGKKLTVNYIIEDGELGMSRTKVFENLKILSDIGIIAFAMVEGEKYIVFNPFIAHKGKRIDRTTTKLFTSESGL